MNYFESGDKDDFTAEIRTHYVKMRLEKLVAVADETILMIGKSLFKKGKRKVDKR